MYKHRNEYEYIRAQCYIQEAFNLNEIYFCYSPKYLSRKCYAKIGMWVEHSFSRVRDLGSSE